MTTQDFMLALERQWSKQLPVQKKSDYFRKIGRFTEDQRQQRTSRPDRAEPIDEPTQEESEKTTSPSPVCVSGLRLATRCGGPVCREKM